VRGRRSEIGDQRQSPSLPSPRTPPRSGGGGGAAPAFVQPEAKLGWRERAADAEALHLVTAELLEHGPGFGILDAFGDDAHPEIVGQVDRRMDKHAGALIAGHVHDERSVDFEIVDWQVQDHLAAFDGLRELAGQRSSVVLRLDLRQIERRSVGVGE
jgi:hypothetical protein